jgi:hypothetical protein
MANNATPSVPSFTAASKAAGVPIQLRTEDVSAMGVVTWLDAEEMVVTLPDGSGKTTDGYFCTLVDTDGTKYTVFVGGVALTRIIRDVPMPFSAQIVKSGRTWVFAD